ncbi:MAG: ASCH domain-containing protein [Prevotellaceae bacterium]|jgi:hypothetical protein|nr:ASCH domain-containing protein [Prevotellaceae bacterium]
MKALTVKQPYAHLICKGIKDVENRTWKTNFRGRALIHAGKTVIQPTFAVAGQATAEEIEFSTAVNFVEENDLTGAIIGSVEIVDCVRNYKSIWAVPDMWHWVLANAVMFESPMPNVKGRLGFWESGYDEIDCPECGSRQLHNFMDGGIPELGWGNPVHKCEFCENWILESEF